MSRSPTRWLIRTARIGITDLPTNTGWALRKIFAAKGANASRRPRRTATPRWSGRVDDAQRRADEMVAEERAKAEADIEKQFRKVEDEVEADNDRARARAETARSEAQSDVDAAVQEMADARQLADDAARRAQEAAEEARRQARALADEADGEATNANERAAEAERMQQEVSTEGSKLSRLVDDDAELDDLDDKTKDELLDLATTIGIKNRSSMRKTELVTAIRKAS